MFCLNVCMHVMYICLVPTEITGGLWIPWTWSYGWLWTTMWVLRIEARSSARAAHANSWVISPLTQFLAIVQHKKECVWMEFVYEDLSWEWWSKLITTNKTYTVGWGSGIHRITKKHLNGQLPPESEITFIVLSIFALKCMLLEEN